MLFTILLPFARTSEQLICWTCSANMSKIKASLFTHQLESILLHYDHLINSAGTQSCCTLRIRACSAIAARLGSLSTIDQASLINRLQSPPNAADRLTYYSFRLSWTPGILFELATVGLVSHTFGLLLSPCSALFCLPFFIYEMGAHFH